MLFALCFLYFLILSISFQTNSFLLVSFHVFKSKSYYQYMSYRSQGFFLSRTFLFTFSFFQTQCLSKSWFVNFIQFYNKVNSHRRDLSFFQIPVMFPQIHPFETFLFESLVSFFQKVWFQVFQIFFKFSSFPYEMSSFFKNIQSQWSSSHQFKVTVHLSRDDLQIKKEITLIRVEELEATSPCSLLPWSCVKLCLGVLNDHIFFRAIQCHPFIQLEVSVIAVLIHFLSWPLPR